MLNYHVKVGLVPIRRDVTPRPGIFNWEKAEERCAAAVAYIEEHFTSENVRRAVRSRSALCFRGRDASGRSDFLWQRWSREPRRHLHR